MERFYIFVIRNDVWIYIICGLVFLWYSSEFIRARRMLRSAVHGLEIERGRRLQQRAASFIASSAIIIIFIGYVNIQIAPTLPAELLRPPTPTPDIFRTPLSSPTPIGGAVFPNAAETLLMAPTVTLAGSAQTSLAAPEIEQIPSPVPSETPSPNVQLGNCSTEVVISSPPPDVSVGGIVTIFGTASGEEFRGYTVEVFGPSTDGEWQTAIEVLESAPIFDEILGEIDFGELLPGPYTLRLMARSTNGSELATCAIQVSVTSPDS